MHKLLRFFALVAVAACAAEPVSDGDGSGGKNDSAAETIAIGDRHVPRLAAAPIAPADQTKVDTLLAGFLAGAVTDFRTAAVADSSLELAVVDGSGKPVRLGRVGYVRPGLGNVSPSAADVFLLAQHFDTLVILYTNNTDAAAKVVVRRLDAIEGVPVPAAVRDHVKIFAVGSPQLNLINSTQQSDVSLEQLQLLHAKRDELGFDALEEPAWIIAHSQGAIDAVLTDHRLRSEGFAGFEKCSPSELRSTAAG